MNNSGTADNEISFNRKTTAPGLSVGYSWSCSDGSTGNGIIPEDSTIATISGLPQGQIITLSWAANPDTPYGRNLDSVNILYGTNAKTARNYLTLTKGWTILDDMLNDTNCGLPQTITAADITKTYGDDPFVLNATTNSGLIIDYISTGYKTIGENAGTHLIEQGTLLAGNNYDIAYISADFDITKATLNIVAEAKAKVYGTTDPALTYTVTGTLATTANYDLVFTAADFNITKATLNIVAEAKTKVYGTSDPAFTYTVTGLANNDDQSIITGALTRTAGENIGTYEIQQEPKAKVYGTTDPVLTYTVTGLANNDDQSIITGALSRTAGENIGTYEINRATLNIVAEAKAKVYGTTDPVLTYTVTGLANNDDQSIITGALTRTAGETAGIYEIQQGTLATTTNYESCIHNCRFQYQQKQLDVVAEARNKVYGTTDPLHSLSSSVL
ncbi:hypothetical protein FQR65_LT19538 [Abscondita terminalis]|nr:hypothetical protein FQR65_LT19538 [Abscondita terminalis]